MVIETSRKHTFNIHEYAINESIWMTGIDPEDEVHNTIRRMVDDADGAVWGAVIRTVLGLEEFGWEAWIT